MHWDLVHWDLDFTALCPIRFVQGRATSTAVKKTAAFLIPRGTVVQSKFQTRIFPSPHPVISCLPLRDSVTAVTGFGCPIKTLSSLPISTSHNLAVRSKLPDKTKRPSDEKRTDTT